MPIITPNSAVLELAIETEANNPWIGIDNRITYETVSADSEDDLYPVVHLANQSTDLTQRWQAADTDSCVLSFDTSGSPLDIDYFAIALHNLASEQITFKLEAYIVDTWTEIISTMYLGVDDPHIFRFDSVNSEAFRVTLGSGSAPASIATAKLGKLTVVPTRLYVGHTPIRFGRTTTSYSARNQSGQFLGRVVTGEIYSATMPLKNLPPAWVRETFAPVIDLMQEETFFVAWRPSEYPDEVAYAWIPSGRDPKPMNQRNNGMMSVSLNLEGII